MSYIILISTLCSYIMHIFFRQSLLVSYSFTSLAPSPLIVLFLIGEQGFGFGVQPRILVIDPPAIIRWQTGHEQDDEAEYGESLLSYQ